MAGRIKGQGSKRCRPSTRQSLYSRDGFACVYCAQGSEEGVVLTLDHVLACELGGTNAPTNLVTACLSCNSAKRDLTMREWYAMLRDRDRGIDTTGMAARVRRATARKIDRAEGLRLVGLRVAS